MHVLQQENANLEATIAQLTEENREQQNALKEHVKQLFEQNSELQAKIAQLEKAGQVSIIGFMDQSKIECITPFTTEQAAGANSKQVEDLRKQVAELQTAVETEKANYATLKSEYEKKIAETVQKSVDEVNSWKSKAETAERSVFELTAKCDQLTAGIIQFLII